MNAKEKRQCNNRPKCSRRDVKEDKEEDRRRGKAIWDEHLYIYITKYSALHCPLWFGSQSDSASGAHMTRSQWWRGANTTAPSLKSRTLPLFRCLERPVSFVLCIAVSVTHFLRHDRDRCAYGVLGEIVPNLIAALNYILLYQQSLNAVLVSQSQSQISTSKIIAPW